jgi:hypothetical protein
MIAPLPNTNLIVPQFQKPRQLARQVGGSLVCQAIFFTLMAGSSAFTPGSHIKFGTLDFLSTTTEALCLANHDEPVNADTVPQRSLGNEVEKRCFGQPAIAIKRQAEEAPQPIPETVGIKRRHKSSKQEVDTSEPSSPPRHRWMEILRLRTYPLVSSPSSARIASAGSSWTEGALSASYMSRPSMP